jgi:chitinase
VTINGDQVRESNETFLVGLSSPLGATIFDSQAQGSITNDD